MVLKKRRLKKYKKIVFFAKRVQKSYLDFVKAEMTSRKILFLSKKLKNEWDSYYKNFFDLMFNYYNLTDNQKFKEDLKKDFFKPLILLKKSFKEFVLNFKENRHIIFSQQIKSKKRSYWKRYSKINSILNKKKVLKFSKLLYFFYKKVLSFMYFLKSFELKFLRHVCTSSVDNVVLQNQLKDLFIFDEKNNFEFSKKDFKTKYIPVILDLLNSREELLKKKYLLTEIKKSFILKSSFYTDNVLKRRNKKNKFNALRKYIKNMRKIKVNKRAFLIPRLKHIHMYIPSYIYFDYKTIRGLIMYTPKPNEIYYSFKASLTEIYSFYKSCGY